MYQRNVLSGFNPLTVIGYIHKSYLGKCQDLKFKLSFCFLAFYALCPIIVSKSSTIIWPLQLFCGSQRVKWETEPVRKNYIFPPKFIMYEHMMS